MLLPPVAIDGLNRGQSANDHHDDTCKEVLVLIRNGKKDQLQTRESTTASGKTNSNNTDKFSQLASVNRLREKAN